jgi:hypothetical protein
MVIQLVRQGEVWLELSNQPYEWLSGLLQSVLEGIIYYSPVIILHRKKTVVITQHPLLLWARIDQPIILIWGVSGSSSGNGCDLFPQFSSVLAGPGQYINLGHSCFHILSSS